MIINDHNAGFTRPTNQAFEISQGRYALLLNNDTVILPGALDLLVEFADAHPKIGICTPKVLNRDGTFQKQCRRGLATQCPVLVCSFAARCWIKSACSTNDSLRTKRILTFVTARGRPAGKYITTQAQIIHIAGQGGSRAQPYRSIWEWHRSYFLHYRKNLAARYFFLFNWFYYIVMVLKLASAILVNFLRKEKFAGSRKP